MYTLPFKRGQKLIEVGSGERPMLRAMGMEVVNLDIRPLPGVDIVADLSGPLLLGEREYDGVFGHYCLEHISWRQVRSFVQEVNRILKPGGMAVFFTANTEAQMRWALEQPQDEGWMERVSQCLMGDLDYPENGHKVVFSPRSLVQLFLAAGFSRVEIYEHEAPTDCIVEAVK